MRNIKYYIIPVDGYDAITTIKSIDEVLGRDSEAEILKSNDMSQVLETPYMNGYNNDYSLCITSDYECVANPYDLSKDFEEKNPFIYSEDQKIFMVDMGHGKCVRNFTQSNIANGHIKTYLNFDLSSAHIYKCSPNFPKYFRKRGQEIQSRREKDLLINKEDLEKFKSVVSSSKESPRKYKK